MTRVVLPPTEVIPDRPFTDLRYTAEDVQVMRYMAVSACMVLKDLRYCENSASPLLLHQPDESHWVQRVFITQPGRLRTHKPLTVVGFFGIRSPDANLELAQEFDRRMIPELPNFKDLLAYLSIRLMTSNYANLVLFANAEGKDQINSFHQHGEAIRALTPDFYTSVRLYNGEMPGGIFRIDTLRLVLVKYYDFVSRPLWRAERELTAVNF